LKPKSDSLFACMSEGEEWVSESEEKSLNQLIY
jgi:hypothetical protein